MIIELIQTETGLFVRDPAAPDELGGRVPCHWFALCDNDATTTRRGPIGDGRFGDVPICKRCDDKVEAL